MHTAFLRHKKKADLDILTRKSTKVKSAEITPTSQKIDRIIKRIDEGDIKIPAFQRGFVWKQNQVIELLESIKNEFPIGSILIWKTSDSLNSTRNIAGYQIPDRGDLYPVNYVLDGQQRLATIYGVFSQCTVQEKDPNGYNPLKNIFEISYDFEKCEFMPDSEVKTQQCAIKLRILLNVTTLIPALGMLDSKYHTDAQKLASQFLNYEIPVVTIENRNKKDVGVIFERINNTGAKLGLIDLMTAWTWTTDFHLLEQTNEFLEELEEKNFGSLKHKTVLQTISAIIQDSTVTDKILGLTGESIRDNWESVKEAIRKAVDFLSTDLHCKHLDFLPFHQQLIPIAKFYHVNKAPTAKQIEYLRVWFWRTAFSERYTSGQTNAKIDSDLQIISQIANSQSIDLGSIKISCTDHQLKNTVFSKSSTLTKAFLLLLANEGPKDLVKNQKIDVDKALSAYNRREYHHVFPNAFLTSTGLNHEQIFPVLNFCFLSAESNKRISKKSPSDYFKSFVPAGDEILKLNMLPVDRAIYQSDDYNLFLSKRAEIILKRIEERTRIV